MSTTEPSALHLHRVLSGLARASTPHDAATTILRECVSRASATAGHIYLLNLSTAQYEAYVSWPDHAGMAAPVSVEQVDDLRDSLVPLEVRFRAAADRETDSEVGVILLATRGSTCVGAIRLDGVGLAELGGHALADMTACSELLVRVHADRFLLAFLDALRSPVDFSNAPEEFHQELALLIAQSSTMEFVVLRERTGHWLRCVSRWGFPDDAAGDPTWDVKLATAHSAFHRTLGRESCVFGNVGADTPPVRELTASGVRSMVLLPVLAGSTILGVLSLGARCPYDYSDTELRAFQSIANIVGAAMASYTSSQELSARVGEYTEASVAITALEVARAARHEARGRIDNCFLGLRNLTMLLRESPRAVPTDDRAASEIEALSRDLRELSDTLDKIKTATRPPGRELQRARVVDIFQQARAAVAGRLQALRVEVVWSGPGLDVDAQPDWLRQVFLNLLLNSLDAFGELRRRRVRRIWVTTVEAVGRTDNHELTYRDNATGINPQRLQVPAEHSQLGLEQAVFAPGVTSKPEGSGFGLWLARRIVDEHGGSMALVDYRNGVMFRIRLPKAGLGR